MTSNKILYAALFVAIIAIAVAAAYYVELTQSSQFSVPTSSQFESLFGPGVYTLCPNAACSSSSSAPLPANSTGSSNRTNPSSTKSVPASQIVRISLIAMVLFNGTSSPVKLSESVSNITGNITLAYKRASIITKPHASPGLSVVAYNGTTDGMNYSVSIISSINGTSNNVALVGYKGNTLASVNVASTKSFLTSQVQSEMITLIAGSIG